MSDTAPTPTAESRGTAAPLDGLDRTCAAQLAEAATLSKAGEARRRLLIESGILTTGLGAGRS